MWEQLALARAKSVEDPLLEARVHVAMGDALWDQAKFDEAIARKQTALELREAALGPDDLQVINVHVDLGHVLAAKGDVEGAREVFLDARERYLAELGPDHPSLARIDNELGSLAWHAGQTDEARNYYERALGIRERAVGKDSPTLAGLIGNIGATYANQGDYQAALPYFERAVNINRAQGDSALVATALDNLAALEVRLDHMDRARSLYEEAYEVRKRVLAADHPDLARSLINMSQFEIEQGRLELGKQMLEEAVARREGLDVQQQYRGRARWKLAEVLVMLHQMKEVPKLLQLAAEDYEQAGITGGPEYERFVASREWLEKGRLPPAAKPKPKPK